MNFALIYVLISEESLFLNETFTSKEFDEILCHLFRMRKFEIMSKNLQALSDLHCLGTIVWLNVYIIICSMRL